VSVSRPARLLGLATLLACGAEPVKSGRIAEQPRDEPDVSGARLFATPVLHMIEITVEAQHLETLENDQSVRVPCAIVYDDLTVSEAGIRKKGQTSMRPLADKPSFSIKMDELVDGLRLDGMKRVTLSSMIEDAALVAEHLGEEIYRRAGLPTPRSAYAVVTFNGEVKGLYLVREAIDAQFFERWLGDGDGNTYEGPWDFAAGVEAADLKDEVSEGRARDDLEALAAAVETDDAGFEQAVDARLDLAQLITVFAADGLYNNYDGYTWAAWNFYLYDNPADGRFVMVSLGYDWPFRHTDSDPRNIWSYPWGEQFPPGYIAERVRGIEALDARFAAEVRRLARDAWVVPELLARLANAAGVVHAASTDDWRTADDVAAFDAGYDEVVEWVEERGAYLATY
jgi:spore coat protein H